MRAPGSRAQTLMSDSPQCPHPIILRGVVGPRGERGQKNVRRPELAEHAQPPLGVRVGQAALAPAAVEAWMLATCRDS